MDSRTLLTSVGDRSGFDPPSPGVEASAPCAVSEIQLAAKRSIAAPGKYELMRVGSYGYERYLFGISIPGRAGLNPDSSIAALVCVLAWKPGMGARSAALISIPVGIFEAMAISSCWRCQASAMVGDAKYGALFTNSAQCLPLSDFRSAVGAPNPAPAAGISAAPPYFARAFFVAWMDCL